MHLWFRKTLYVSHVSTPGFRELVRRARARQAAILELDKAEWTLILTPSADRCKRRQDRSRSPLFGLAVLAFLLLLAITMTIFPKPAIGSWRVGVETPLQHWIDRL